MMRLIPLTLLAAAAALAGCATPPRCELSDGRELCASMGETYRAAMSGAGGRDNVLGSADDDAKKADAARLNIQSGRHQLAGPVYLPPKPYRFWVAPWTDANGLLHSGEQVFFTTPGQWTYGEMGKPGAAAGLLAPIKPEDLGFFPVVANPEEKAERERNTRNRRPSGANDNAQTVPDRRDQRRNGVTLPVREISKMSETRQGKE